MRTAETIEEQKSVNAPKKDRRGTHPNSLKNLVAPWQKGTSGNPGGMPGYDVGAAIARKVLELNEEQIYMGLAKAAIQGNAYAYKELCDRGYGKLKEMVEHSGEITITNRLIAARKRLSERNE